MKTLLTMPCEFPMGAKEWRESKTFIQIGRHSEKLENSVVKVTGAGQGIGRAIVSSPAGDGTNIAVVNHSKRRR